MKGCFIVGGTERLMKWLFHSVTDREADEVLVP